MRTHRASPSCLPLWTRAPCSGPPGWRFLCRWTASHRCRPASSPPPRPLGSPEGGPSRFSLAKFCPSPADGKRSYERPGLSRRATNVSIRNLLVINSPESHTLRPRHTWSGSPTRLFPPVYLKKWCCGGQFPELVSQTTGETPPRVCMSTG